MIYTFRARLSKWILNTSRLPTPLILFLGLIIQFLIMLGFALFWWKNVNDQFAFEKTTMGILMIVILAPFLETVLFQYAIIDYVLTKYKSELAAILISAAAFSLTHFYSAQYLVATFFSGILFAYIFIVFRVKTKNPILLTFFLHAVYNGMLLLLKTMNT